LASPEKILSWSHGEVTKPETINYRTQRAEKDGLFCQKIFGPEKDFQCYCGKYKGIRYKGLICDRCGVEITKSSVRRERMGHIKLATPVSHIWFLKGVPSRMGMILDISMQQLERVIYFSSYIIVTVNEDVKKNILESIEKEYKQKLKIARREKKVKERAEKIKKLNEEKEKAVREVSLIKPLRVISEVEYYNLSLKYGEAFTAGTGAETLRKIFEKIDLKKEIEKLKEKKEESSPEARRKNLRRLRIFEAMEKENIRPEWMFLTVLPVIPPDLRPMVQLDGGRYASSDLNDLYRRVINRNNRLKYLLEINAPDVIVRNEKRMLQEAVDSLIDNGMRKGTTTKATTGGRRLLKSLADTLKGKQGRFRQNLLGKRVDYSGRSVIVVGPELKINQVGISKKMALELFKPFVIRKLLEKEIVYNVKAGSRLIDEQTDDVWACLEEVVKDKLVLLNRAPTLHRLSIQAFYPILIEGETIRIHPTVCKSFNADFDGDQMAVHLPLSDRSQQEAREQMLSSINLLKPATGMPVVTLHQDIILGCYWLTDIKDNETKQGEKFFKHPKEAIMAYEFGNINLREKIKVFDPKGIDKPSSDNRKKLIKKEEFIETSVGRIIFNETLPSDFPFQNKLVKLRDLEGILGEVIEGYPGEVVEEVIDKIKHLGFEYSTLSGITFGMNDLIVPKNKRSILEKAEKEVEEIKKYFTKGLLSEREKSNKIIEIWTKAKSEIEKEVPQTLPSDNPIFQMVDAGARGSWSQPIQMTGIKGLVTNPVGDVIELPVKSSYKEGFDVLEYFISTHGARKGAADTALRTSTAGYLTRKLVDVSHEVIISEEDCGDEVGIEVFRKDSDDIGQDFSFKIVGRVSLETIKGIVKKGEIIDWEKAKKIINAKIDRVRVRSVLTCKTTRGVCRKCYGWDLGYNRLVDLGGAVGVVAAQAIGEPGTQLTLRTFHYGGVAGGGDITQGLPRIEEIFEARVPKGKAAISLTDGVVLEVTKEKVIRIKPDKENKTLKNKKEKLEIIEYPVSANASIWVKKGDRVRKGQQLCEGSLDLKELFKLSGYQSTWRYMINEIQKVYFSQGAYIQDKHIEVILKQMFSRMRVKEPGDSVFNTGEIVERAQFIEENLRLKKEKKELAKAVPVLLGISKVALTTDSFLSAASFQETSRVLIRAAIEGKEDKLRGLKENTIIGRLIPAGTGFRLKPKNGKIKEDEKEDKNKKQQKK